MQVLPDKLDEVLPAIFSIWDKPFCLDFVCHVVHLTSSTKIGSIAPLFFILAAVEAGKKKRNTLSNRDSLGDPRRIPF